MKLTALSVQATTFKDDKTGLDRSMWRVFCADLTGAVGSVYSPHEVKTGDSVELILSVNRDGKFVAKIKPAQDLYDGKSYAKKTVSDFKPLKSDDNLSF